MWVQRAVGGLLAFNVGSLAVSVSPSLCLLAWNVSRKCPLFAGLGATVCKPLHLGLSRVFGRAGKTERLTFCFPYGPPEKSKDAASIFCVAVNGHPALTGCPLRLTYD